MDVVRLMDMARRGGDGERGEAPPSYPVPEEVPDPELDGTCTEISYNVGRFHRTQTAGHN